MTHTRTLTIASESDIVLLRMYVRDLARAIGLNLADQARISLAAASVAKAIGLGLSHQGQVTAGDCCRDGRTGVRVVCTGNNDEVDHAPGALRDARWMVDELTFENVPSSIVQVTLVKWRE
jgi:hypothetical protein